jgi:glutamyl-tRNA synthetase
MMNYLARLGWSHDASTEMFTRADLIEKFTLDRVNSSPASHDPDKLHWLQGEWMKTLSTEQKVQAVLPFLEREGLAANAPREKVAAVVEALGDRLKTFSDAVKLGRYFFTDTLAHDPDAVKKRLKKDGVPAMLADLRGLLETVEPYDLAALEKAVHDFAETRGIKMGDVVNPLRVAVTGQGVGPGLYDCLVILGREACVRRIGETLEMLGAEAAS